MSESKQELIFKSTEIKAYDPFRSQLQELKEGNSKVVFDYRDPKGNKEARSHIYKLRQSKGALEKARKAEKESFLLKGRLVDAEAKEIEKEIEAMIDVHEKPLIEIENEEKMRIQSHKDRIFKMASFLNMPKLGYSSDEIKFNWNAFTAFEPNESFEEFTADALRTYKAVIERFEFEYNETLSREAEQVELDRLRHEAAESARIAREREIAEAAAAQARADVEREAEETARRAADYIEAADRARVKAEQDAEAARVKALNDAEAARVKAAQDYENARLKAIRDQEAAVEAERAKQAAEAAQIKREEEQRAANVEHQRAVHREIIGAVVEAGYSEEFAKDLITAIRKSNCKRITINY